MPKINQNFIKATFYLYATEQDALNGVNAGGTGFIVSVKTGENGLAYYGITNRHVLLSGSSVVRLNTKEGSVDTFVFDPSDWELHPTAAVDVAAIPLALNSTHQVSSIFEDFFIEEGRHSFEVGDDTFMIGLFVDHEGREVNRPLARFGNISMLASKNAKIANQEAFIVDMHSRSGFSGSPVFAYRTFGSDLNDGVYDNLAIDLRPIEHQIQRALERSGGLQRGMMQSEIWTRARTTPDVVLLGIHFGQFPERWEVKQIEQVSREDLAPEKNFTNYVVGLSGMTCVVPAWKIREVLDLPVFLNQRKAAAESAKNQSIPEFTLGSTPTQDADPPVDEKPTTG